ncbi:peptidase S41 [Phormidium tenue FACHB-886]|nr:peptidase S41 [Phormidium tenue FACHB-886]
MAKKASKSKSDSKSESKSDAKSTTLELDQASEQAPVTEPSAAVEGELNAVGLPTFLKTVGALSLADRRLIVEQALILLEQCYVHLPLKQKMHAVQPLQRLKVLQYQLAQLPEDQLPSEFQFHNEMTEIFNSVRDLHTNYFLPEPFAAQTAFLPFLIEEYFEDGQPKYLVSKVAGWFEHLTFKPGVEVTYWNGMPIARAVERNADRQAGSNSEASRARGIEALTVRPLFISPPPDEEWIVVGYKTADGRQLELRQDWLVTSFFNPKWKPETLEESAAQGIDIQTRSVQQTKKQLFFPDVAAAEEQLSDTETAPKPAEGLETNLPGTLQARVIERNGKSYGYLRIYTFSIHPDQLLPEVIRLIELLPQEGLIVDVRGNGGGIIWSGERLLQLFTPRTIEPQRLEFVNTPLTLEMGRLTPWLSEWTESIQQSVTTGAVFSNGFPITPVADCNSIGQKYHGPVVLVTDALCYSTTDIFAAGFQDHKIGPILGASGNTGAGGANVWDHELIGSLLQGSPNSPIKPMPNGGGMRVAIRRTLRVGDRQGTPVEDLGVIPDYRHYMTKNDLLNSNVDLIARAASLLDEMPHYRLEIESQSKTEETLKLKVMTYHLSRLDVYLDGRPQRSLDVKNGKTSFSMKLPHEAVLMVELRGFSEDQLVAVDRQPLQ